MKQINLLPPPSLFFGGDLGSDPKRSQRILSTKLPTHLVLKSKPSFKLFKNKSVIEEIIKKQAKKFGVKIYGLSVQKDHIHLNIRIFSRNTYKAFIRAITGLIARKLGKGIWKFRPFTRIVKWGRPFEILKKYIIQNELEIQGVIPYQRRRYKYKARSNIITESTSQKSPWSMSCPCPGLKNERRFKAKILPSPPICC